LFVGLFEDDDESSDDDDSDSELLTPKHENMSISSCCHGDATTGKTYKIKSVRDQEVQAIPQGIDGLVGSATEHMESIDEILGYKNLSAELNNLDVEPGTLGDSGISVWEESFTDLFPSLL
jgi:hypothetical protein